MSIKKKLAVLIAAVCIATAPTAIFIGCGDKPLPPDSGLVTPDVTLTLDKKSVTIDPHETVALDATLIGSTEPIVWTSSDESVATVTDGKVTGIKVGSAVIIAKVGDVTAECEVTVAESGASPELNIDAAGGVINVGKNGEITVNSSFTFKGAPIADDIAVSWSLKSGEPQDVASITPSAGGKSAVVKGLKYGRTAVEVSAVVWGVPILETYVINVINVDITFEVADTTPEEGGYAARVSVIDIDGHKSERIIDVSVFNKGEKVQNPVFEWSSSNDNIVAVDSTGKLKGISAGTATVTGIYDDGITLTLFVTVYRPEVAVDTPLEFETYTGGEFVFDDAYIGTPQKVMIAGKDALASYDGATRTVVLDKTKLPVSAKDLGKTKLTVVTDKIEYVYENVELYTKKIGTKEELAKFSTYLTKTVAGSNSNEESSKFYWWDGYIVLDDDIDFGGDTLDSFIYWATNNTQDGTRSGFRGVFDGRGHIIDNMRIDGKNERIGGFIGLLATEGVIQNVAFTNAVHTGYCGYVCSAGNGTVKNVYVSYSSFGKGEVSGNERAGTFFAYSSGANANLTDCFVEVKGYEAEKGAYSIGSACAGNLSRVFGVGFDRGFFDTADAPDDNAGSFSTYAEMGRADIDFAAMDDSFWKVVDGIPYPKTLETIPAREKANLSATVVGINALTGKSVDVKNKKFKLVGLYDSYDVQLGDSAALSIENVFKGSYKVVAGDAYKTSFVTFDGDALEIPLRYLGEVSAPNDINSTSFSHSATIDDETVGQFIIEEFGNGRNFTYLLSKKSYNALDVTAHFTGTNFTGWNNHRGIELVFENGKGVYLEFNSQGGNKLSFVSSFLDSDKSKESSYAITNGLINDSEIEVVPSIAQALVDKLNSEDGLNLRVVRNGNMLSVYLDNEFVKTVALPEEYAEQTVRYAFCGIWSSVENFAFSVSDEIPNGAGVSVTGIAESYNGGTVSYTEKQYKIGEAITLDITPSDGYIVGAITVNGENRTAQWKDNKLVLGYASDIEQTFEVSVVFTDSSEHELNCTVSATNALDGGTVDLVGKTISFVGADGTEHQTTVGAGGAVSFAKMLKGQYTVRFGDGFDEKQVMFEGTALGSLQFTYFGTTVNPPKADGGEWVWVGYIPENCDAGQYRLTLNRDHEKFNYAISAKNYHDFTLTAKYKNFGAWNNHMGIELVFDDGNGSFINGIYLEFDTWSDKLSFVNGFIDSDQTGSHYAIQNLINTEETVVKSGYGFADRLNGDGVILTVVRSGNKVSVIVDGKYAATLTLPEEYANRKAIYAFCGLNARYNGFIYSVDTNAIPAGAINVTGIDQSYTGGTVSYTQKTYALGDEIFVEIAPSENYTVGSVKVNNVDVTDKLYGNKLVLGCATDMAQTFDIEVSFVSATADLSATVTAASVISGEPVDIAGKKITFTAKDGTTHEADVGQNGSVTASGVVKGTFTATLEGEFAPIENIEFDGGALNLEFKYLGTRITVSGAVPAENEVGQFVTSFGGSSYENTVFVKSSAEYDALNVAAVFKPAYSDAGCQRMGIQLVFDDGKGVYFAITGVFNDNKYYNLSLVDQFADSGNEKFALTGGLLASNTSLTDCNPLKAEWLNKFNGEGLKLSLMRNGTNVTAYVEAVAVGSVTLPDEYATKTVKYAFCGRWAMFPNFAFGVSTDVSALPAAGTVTVTGIADSYTGGNVSYTAKQYKVGDEIAVVITAAQDYAIKSVTVGGKDVTANIKGNKLVLGYASDVAQTFDIAVTFIDTREADLSATVTATGKLVGNPVSLVSKTITFTAEDGTVYTTEIKADGAVSIPGMKKGKYTASIADNFDTVSVIFDGSALDIKFIDSGFTDIVVSDGKIPAESNVGQFKTSFGGSNYDNSVFVTSGAEYDALNVAAIFKPEYSDTGCQRMGMQLVFGDNKGVYFAITGKYVDGKWAYDIDLADAFQDNGNEYFALSGGLLASDTNLIDCKPLKNEWLNKFNNEGLKLSLVRYGKYVAAYVEDRQVGMVVLPNEYASQKVKYAFCGRWAKFPDFAFGAGTNPPSDTAETATLTADVGGTGALTVAINDMNGSTVTLTDIYGNTKSAVVTNGKIEIADLKKGGYIASTNKAGFDPVFVLFDGGALDIRFAYHTVSIYPGKADGGEWVYASYISDAYATGQYSMTLARQNEKFNYAISGASYDALTLSAKYRDFGAWNNHMGIELLFDDGAGNFTNGVYLEFDTGSDKLSFVNTFVDGTQDGSHYAIKNLINTEETIVKSGYGFADKLNGDGVLLTVVREGSNITVLVDGEYAATLALPQEYATREVKYAFCGLNAHYEDFMFGVQ